MIVIYACNACMRVSKRDREKYGQRKVRIGKKKRGREMDREKKRRMEERPNR